MTLQERHAILDARIDALSLDYVIKLVESELGRWVLNPELARMALRQMHPDDQERLLAPATITISKLRVADLKGLQPHREQAQARDYSTSEHFVQVTHRGQTYRFGLFDCWRGPYWMHDLASGSVFTGDLQACKDFAKLCTECVLEGEA